MEANGRRGRDESGYSFIELLVVTVILLVLASAIAPLTQVTIQRQREVELRRALRDIRTAIDKHKDAVDLGVIGGANLDSENEGYPPDLGTLVEGVETVNGAEGGRVKFLRRIPPDPVAKTSDWGLRAYQDSPDSTRWGGGNVYDVYSKATGTGLDGSRYREW
jgi:general secretion pathway protein G